MNNTFELLGLYCCVGIYLYGLLRVFAELVVCGSGYAFMLVYVMLKIGFFCGGVNE